MRQPGKSNSVDSRAEIDDEPELEEVNPLTEGMTTEEQEAAVLRLYEIVMGRKQSTTTGVM